MNVLLPRCLLGRGIQRDILEGEISGADINMKRWFGLGTSTDPQIRLLLVKKTSHDPFHHSEMPSPSLFSPTICLPKVSSLRPAELGFLLLVASIHEKVPKGVASRLQEREEVAASGDTYAGTLWKAPFSQHQLGANFSFFLRLSHH